MYFNNLHKAHPKKEVFKIQRPIINHKPSQVILIYNKRKSVYGEITITQEIAKLMGTEMKIYVKGYVDSQGIFQIEEKVTPKRW